LTFVAADFKELSLNGFKISNVELSEGTMKITTVRVDDDGDEVFEEKEMTITAAAAAVAFDYFKKNKKEEVALANKEAAGRFVTPRAQPQTLGSADWF
jgi:hypothetical protein